MGAFASGHVLASPQKSIEPKEIRYVSSNWQGTDAITGYHVRLELDSNLSMGIVKGAPFYLCSGTWKLIDITIPEQDAELAGINVQQFAKDIPDAVINTISLQQLHAQFALDRRNNFGLACNLGKFSPSSQTAVSQNMPAIEGWQNLIINSVDNQYVNETLAKDVVYEFVGVLRKDTTMKIAQQPPHIVDIEIDLSGFKVWLADLAQQKLLSNGVNDLQQNYVPDAVYSNDHGFNDQQFDLFMQNLYEQKRLAEGTNKIEQRFTANLSFASHVSVNPDTNRTCARSEDLKQVMGSWFSGTSMFKIIDKCHGIAPDYGFVRTELCAVPQRSIDELLTTPELTTSNATQVNSLPDITSGDSAKGFCPKPLMQFVSLKNGSQVSPAKYLQTSGFSKQGLAAVQLVDEQWQIITSGFNTRKPLPDVVSFRGGFHHERIIFKSTNGLYGAMDPNFSVVIPPKYEEIQSFSSKITRVKYQGNYGVINKTGDWVVPAKFAKAGFVENNHILVREDEQAVSPWLLINSEGVLVKQTEAAGGSPPPIHALLK
ncbi:WG repeat-containing protein [Thalassotalea litorea]|uniref:WG repeat-containing protein n=1 Tax=Thalassotalea litorea TaxID=2020715 RepID=UPI0037361628